MAGVVHQDQGAELPLPGGGEVTACMVQAGRHPGAGSRHHEANPLHQGAEGARPARVGQVIQRNHHDEGEAPPKPGAAQQAPEQGGGLGSEQKPPKPASCMAMASAIQGRGGFAPLAGRAFTCPPFAGSPFARPALACGALLLEGLGTRDIGPPANLVIVAAPRLLALGRGAGRSRLGLGNLSPLGRFGLGGGVLNELEQLDQLVVGEIAPLPHRQPLEADVHDADALELGHLEAEVLAHAADLAVETLHQGDAKHEGRLSLHLALLGDGAEDGHPGRHAPDELVGHRLVHGHQVLFLVIVARPQDLVHQIPVVGEEDEPLGVLVQAPYGEDAGAVVDEVDDVVLLPRLRGADDAHRLVEGDEDQAVGLARLDHLTVDLDQIPGKHLIPHPGPLAVDEDVALLDETIGLTTGADAALADVFVQAHGFIGQHGSPPGSDGP
ncbi:hypothetical protein BFG06_19090 [Aeromonas caviae]|nr:hypothetical protein BFG06_19090 [Aeromonas caviae]